MIRDILIVLLFVVGAPVALIALLGAWGIPLAVASGVTVLMWAERRENGKW